MKIVQILDFQIRAQLEEHGISSYKFAFNPENSKDNWMCDLAPFAVVGSNTIIQVADNPDHENHADDAGQYFLPKKSRQKFKNEYGRSCWSIFSAQNSRHNLKNEYFRSC